MYYVNGKRVIKLPSIAFNMLVEKVCEQSTTWKFTQTDKTYSKGRTFELFGVVYEEELPEKDSWHPLVWDVKTLNK